MLRMRTPAGLLLLALLALGVAANAGATLLAGGGCCASMAGMGPEAERAAPCASLTPGSCCEERAPAAGAAAAHAPALATALAPAPAPAAPRARAERTLASPRTALRSLATVVLRL